MRKAKGSKSDSNISISEYISASDLNPDIVPLHVGLRRQPSRTSREFFPSPLIGSDISLPKRNTVVHASQSNPNLRLESLDMPGPATKKGKGRGKRNPVLDEVSHDFSQESLDTMNNIVDKITFEEEYNEPSTSTESPGTSLPTQQGQQPKQRRKREQPKRNDSLDRLSGTSLLSSSSRTVKNNDMLESMRLMINKSVSEAVESATRKLHNDLQAMQTTFNSQISKLSDKKTRHHLENQITAKDDKESITAKLISLEELKPQMQEIQKKMESRLTEMESRLESFQNLHDERCTSLEIVEERHYGITINKLTGLENSQRNLAKSFEESNSQL